MTIPNFSHNNYHLRYNLLIFISISVIILQSYSAQCIDQRTFDTRDIEPTGSQDGPQETTQYKPSQVPPEEGLEEPSFPRPNELSVVRLNDTSIVLRWEFDAQENLQYFKVQRRRGSKETNWITESTEIAPMSRAFQINGLRPGNYFFIVSAVFENDDSGSSEPFKYKLRAKSKIPPDEMPEMKAPVIFWSEAKSDYFRFKWRYEPKKADIDIFGFLVYYRSAHVVTDFLIYSTLDTSVEITNLEAGTPYEAKVVAYNQVGVSEFSETIQMRTESNTTDIDTYPVTGVTQQATTTPIPLSTTPATTTITTKKPFGWETTTSTQAPVEVYTTTQSPNLNGTSNNQQANDLISQLTTIVNDIQQSVSKAWNAILGDQSDAMLRIRTLLLVLLPIIFIVAVLICLIRPPNTLKKKGSSAPSTTSTEDSLDFDLEVNSYFKNSFPGVEKDYDSSVANHIEIRNSFVNNHPHLNDFA